MGILIKQEKDMDAYMHECVKNYLKNGYSKINNGAKKHAKSQRARQWRKIYIGCVQKKSSIYT